MFVSTLHKVLFDIQFYSQSAALILKMLDIYTSWYWLYSDVIYFLSFVLHEKTYDFKTDILLVIKRTWKIQSFYLLDISKSVRWSFKMIYFAFMLDFSVLVIS